MAAPTAPQNLTQTSGISWVDLAWDDLADDTITNWQYKRWYSDPWKNMEGATPSTTSYRVFPLTPNSNYPLYIRAVNADGNGAAATITGYTNDPPLFSPPTTPEAGDVIEQSSMVRAATTTLPTDAEAVQYREILCNQIDQSWSRWDPATMTVENGGNSWDSCFAMPAYGIGIRTGAYPIAGSAHTRQELIDRLKATVNRWASTHKSVDGTGSHGYHNQSTFELGFVLFGLWCAMEEFSDAEVDAWWPIVWAEWSYYVDQTRVEVNGTPGRYSQAYTGSLVRVRTADNKLVPRGGNELYIADTWSEQMSADTWFFEVAAMMFGNYANIADWAELAKRLRVVSVARRDDQYDTRTIDGKVVGTDWWNGWNLSKQYGLGNHSARFERRGLPFTTYQGPVIRNAWLGVLAYMMAGQKFPQCNLYNQPEQYDMHCAYPWQQFHVNGTFFGDGGPIYKADGTINWPCIQGSGVNTTGWPAQYSNSDGNRTGRIGNWAMVDTFAKIILEDSRAQGWETLHLNKFHQYRGPGKNFNNESVIDCAAPYLLYWLKHNNLLQLPTPLPPKNIAAPTPVLSRSGVSIQVRGGGGTFANPQDRWIGWEHLPYDLDLNSMSVYARDLYETNINPDILRRGDFIIHSVRFTSQGTNNGLLRIQWQGRLPENFQLKLEGSSQTWTKSFADLGMSEEPEWEFVNTDNTYASSSDDYTKLLAIFGGTNTVGKTLTVTIEPTTGNTPGPTFGGSEVGELEFFAGEAVDITLPAAQGKTGVTYAISPALPDGLTFDPTTRRITGIPTSVVAEQEYTITAT